MRQTTTGWQWNLNTCRSLWQVTDDWSLFILRCKQTTRDSSRRVTHRSHTWWKFKKISKELTDVRERDEQKFPLNAIDKWVHFQFDFTFASEKYRIFLSIRNPHFFHHFQVIICNFTSFEGKLFDILLEFSPRYDRECLSEWSIIFLLFDLKRFSPQQNRRTSWAAWKRTYAIEISHSKEQDSRKISNWRTGSTTNARRMTIIPSTSKCYEKLNKIDARKNLICIRTESISLSPRPIIAMEKEKKDFSFEYDSGEVEIEHQFRSRSEGKREISTELQFDSFRIDILHQLWSWLQEEEVFSLTIKLTFTSNRNQRMISIETRDTISNYSVELSSNIDLRQKRERKQNWFQSQFDSARTVIRHASPSRKEKNFIFRLSFQSNTASHWEDRRKELSFLTIIRLSSDWNRTLSYIERREKMS